MKIKISLIALFLLLSNAAWSLEVDLAQSNVKWAGHKLVGGHIGKISIKSASLTWNNDQLTGGRIVMDLNTVTVDDLQGEKQTKFLNHMKSDDFFNVEKFPEAIFEITAVTKENLKGKMTIKGQTMETEIPYNRANNKVTGTFSFDRTKFGLVYNSSNFFKDLVADKIIKDEVDLNFEIVLK